MNDVVMCDRCGRRKSKSMGCPDKCKTVQGELSDALRFRNAALKALPVDEEADAIVSRLLDQRPVGYVTRKLKRRGE